MHYRLRENLSCCYVDGHMFFLDIAQDRYFKLTGALEKAMRRLQAQESVAPIFLEHLKASGILAEASALEANALITNIQRPSRSAIEQPFTIENRQISVVLTLEVMAIIFSIHHQMKKCTFKTILDRASAYRDRKSNARGFATFAALEHNLFLASRQYASARRYVPVEPVCLLDSLSLLRFLSRRGLPARIVFGVKPEPFTAHCWVQAGNTVLNETLSDTYAYTAIRMV